MQYCVREAALYFIRRTEVRHDECVASFTGENRFGKAKEIIHFAVANSGVHCYIRLCAHAVAELYGIPYRVLVEVFRAHSV